MGWSELIGRQLDEYEIVQEIARGGMSRVYHARDVAATRDVAIKVMLLGSEGNDSTFARRFQHEAQAVERLDHPNIVKVFTTGQTDEFVYMVMQLVTGGTFRDRLKRGQVMPVPEACAYIEQMARALHHAHTHHVIHRDVKPANMLIDQYDPHHLLLADFGIAKIIGQKGVTKTGTAVGTPEYMAPEQAKGEEIDPRADIYGLACVLYEALAGRPPFQGPTALSICYQHVHTRPAYIRGFNPEVPRQLALVVEQALAKNPRDRYATADDFANALYAFTEPKGPVIRRSLSAPITPPGLDLRATTDHSEGQSSPNIPARDPAANSGVSVIPPFDSQGNALPFTTSPALDFSALSARPPLTPSPVEDDATTRPTQEIVPIMSPARPRHTRPVVPPEVRLRSRTITAPRPGADDPTALPTEQLPISDAAPVLPRKGKRLGTSEIEPRRRPLLILVAVAIVVSLLTLLLITRLNASTTTPIAQSTPTATILPTATTVPTVAATGTRPAATVTPTVNIAAKYITLVTTTASPDETCNAANSVNHFTAGSRVFYNICLAPGTPLGTISVAGYHDGTFLTPSPKAQVSNTSGSPEGYYLYYTYGLQAGNYTIDAQWNGQTARTITFTVS